jgi:hypothetical protein
MISPQGWFWGVLRGFDEFELKYARSIILAMAGNLPAAIDALMLRPQSKPAKARLDIIKNLDGPFRNAQVLAKTAATTEEGAATTTETSAIGNQQDCIVDKWKETVKTPTLQSYMTTKQDTNKSNNFNPFVVWQSLMTYWLNAYEESLKNALNILHH